MEMAQRLANQVHQIALLHTALRHAREQMSADAGLPFAAGYEYPPGLRAEVKRALDASENTATEIIQALLQVQQ